MRPIRLQKQTKIVATLAHMNCSAEYIRSLYEEGVNVVRINTAHCEPEDAKKIIDNVRAASEKIGILIDTKGPEIRTNAPLEQVTLEEGATITLDGKQEPCTPQALHCSYDGIVKCVPKGTKILINDGAIELHVNQVLDTALECVVVTGGSFTGRKSINIPDVHIPLPALTPKDRKFIEFAIQEQISFIAHSFVRNKEDLLEIQKILDAHKSPIKIISKIENQEGVDNIHEILKHSYGIMVARGDLGIEIPAERIPAVQKYLIKECIKHQKPVITATQMMQSMVNHPRPTRAEVNDVANAIYDGTDAIMLSDETAIGKYPLETVRMMTRIAIESERHARDHHETVKDLLSTSVSTFLAMSAIQGAKHLPVDSIVIDTRHGRTPRTMAAFRGKTPIHCRCYDKQVMRELSLVYGIHTDYMEPKETTDEFIQYALTRLLDKNYSELDHLVIVVAGNFGPTEEPTFLEVSTVKDLLEITGGEKD